MGFGCMVGQDLVQRSLSSRNDKIAASSSVIAGFFYLAIAVVPITIGFAARLVLAKYNITAETMGGDLENQVLPRMALIILGQLSPVVLILFLCALVSAILSSADSSLLAGASLLTNNVLRPMYPRMSDKTLLMLTRITTIALTVIGTYLALNVKSIYSLMINSWASQLVIVFWPVIGALYFTKSSKNCAWAGMAVSTAVWFSYVFAESCGIQLDPAAVETDGYIAALMQSDGFDHALTCGSVWGFVAGVAAFFFAYLGERIPHWKLDAPEDEEED